jgi:hypothetical protein
MQESGNFLTLLVAEPGKLLFELKHGGCTHGLMVRPEDRGHLLRLQGQSTGNRWENPFDNGCRISIGRWFLAMDQSGSARALACCFRRPRRKLSTSAGQGRTRMSSARAPKTTGVGGCAPRSRSRPAAPWSVCCDLTKGPLPLVRSFIVVAPYRSGFACVRSRAYGRAAKRDDHEERMERAFLPPPQALLMRTAVRRTSGRPRAEPPYPGPVGRGGLAAPRPDWPCGLRRAGSGDSLAFHSPPRQ